MPQTMTPAQEFRSGAREIIPLAAGAGIYGLAFGLLAAQAGIALNLRLLLITASIRDIFTTRPKGL